MKEKLAALLADMGISLDDAALERMARYHALLLDWNTRMDLTNVTDEDEMVARHYGDSLSVLALGLIPPDARLIDVGTGAGFPGLPLAIARPDLRVTLLDALQKRCLFLQAVVEELALPNVQVLHARCEDAARGPLREAFDIATARAVAPLGVLAEYLTPFVRVGGLALCWKGPAVEGELPKARAACKILGAGAPRLVPLPLPGRAHTLAVLEKKQKTLRQYPRKSGTPSREPLGLAK